MAKQPPKKSAAVARPKGPTGRPVTMQPRQPAPPPAKKPVPAQQRPQPVAHPAPPPTRSAAVQRPAPAQRAQSRPQPEQEVRHHPQEEMAEAQGTWDDGTPMEEVQQGAVQTHDDGLPPNLRRNPDNSLPKRPATAVQQRPQVPTRVISGGVVHSPPRGNGALETYFDPNDTGFETVSTSDLLIPRYTILQDLSPQVKQNRSEYIEGAQVGMIYNTATGMLAWEIEVIPAYYERRFIEWKPDRGGFVRDYGTDPSIKDQCTMDEDGYTRWTPGGNILQETMTFYVISISEGDLPAIIPMSSVFMKHGRKWNSIMTSYRLPETRAQGKLWSRSFMLTTAPQQNDKGDWHGWQIDPYKTLEEYDENVIAAVASFRSTLKSGATASVHSIVDDQTDAQGLADNAGVAGAM